jgi:hypothetical protein
MEDKPWDSMSGVNTAAMRWLAGISAAVLASGVGIVVTTARDWDREIVALRQHAAENSRRLDLIEDALRTNRMTRMAPETRTELDSLRREMDAAWDRLQALERARGK